MNYHLFKIPKIGWINEDIYYDCWNEEYKVKPKCEKCNKELKPKYKSGDKVYSYQNPRKPGTVLHIYPSDDPTYDHRYVLILPSGQRSKHINEKSLRKSPIPRGREYL